MRTVYDIRIDGAVLACSWRDDYAQTVMDALAIAANPKPGYWFGSIMWREIEPLVPAGYTAEELERDNPYNQWMYEGEEK